MSKNKIKKRPSKPFTESYQFIQSMFQEPLPWSERIKHVAWILFKVLAIIVGCAFLLGMLSLFIYFDLGQTVLNDNGLTLPKRWP
jgi:ABC-type transporter Mla maintaining outer membrane lipid asymmetry permease subunit MlaE